MENTFHGNHLGDWVNAWGHDRIERLRLRTHGKDNRPFLCSGADGKSYSCLALWCWLFDQ